MGNMKNMNTFNSLFCLFVIVLCLNENTQSLNLMKGLDCHERLARLRERIHGKIPEETRKAINPFFKEESEAAKKQTAVGISCHERIERLREKVMARIVKAVTEEINNFFNSESKEAREEMVKTGTAAGKTGEKKEEGPIVWVNLVFQNKGLCLSAKNQGDAIQVNCGGSEDLLWRVSPVPSTDGQIRLISKNGKVLSIGNQKPRNGGQVLSGPANNQNKELFRFIPLKNQKDI